MDISLNPFLEEEEDVKTPVEVSPPVGDRIGYDTISRQLIRDGFILTALELHTELQEIGNPVGYLRDYFSNPGNFERTKPPELQSTSPPVGLQRSGSIQTFDSLDWARYSDDGERQAEDRVAGLEFELRKAQDTIKSLRKSLTIATEDSGTAEEHSEKTDTSMTAAELNPDAIKPHEKRAINFLVNEYLLRHDYKLTSVTFAEENENQDFEHWDDVGLNISKPPDLLHLYLDFGKHTAPVTNTEEVSTNDNFYADEMAGLQDDLLIMRETVNTRKEEITSLNMAAESLSTEIDILKLENNSLQDKLEAQSSTLMSNPAAQQATITDAEISSPRDDVDSSALSESRRPCELYTYQPINRDVPRTFLNHVLSMSFHVPEGNRIAKQVSQLDGNDTTTIIDMIAHTLPHIVPNVLLAKREELLPLILCAANLHSSLKARDSMLNTLFNLMKKPDRLQRQMILTGCIMFAQYNGPDRVEEELLPQCWEQINDKYMERRLLVVDACCALIPYMSSSIRSSLVLSMLQQMLQDERVDEVRAAVVRSLGILVCFMDDSAKFSQVLTLYSRQVLPDMAPPVQDEAIKVLLPSLALWAVNIDKTSDLMDLLFSALQNSLTEPNEENEIRVIPESFLPVIRHLLKLVNFQFISMLYNGPYSQNSDVYDPEPTSPADNDPGELDGIFSLVKNRSEYYALLEKFHSYTSEEWYKTWDQFDLLIYTTFSKFAMLALSMQTDDIQVVRALVSYIRSVCSVVGKHITNDKIEPKLNEFFKVDDEITSGHHKIYTSSLLPMLICGVKGAFSDADSIVELTASISRFIEVMAENLVPLQSLDIAVTVLLDSMEFLEPVLDTILELFMKSSSLVKTSCAHLLEICLHCPNCSAMIKSKILPGLVTLAHHPDSEVKVCTIPSFSTILDVTSERETIDKVYSEFIHLLQHIDETKDLPMLMSMIAAFGRIGPNIEPQFREKVVIFQLSKWSSENNHRGDTIRRRDVATVLIDTYCALSCCFISNQVVRESFLPGLRALRLDLKELALGGSDVIQSMIKDMESKIGMDNSRHLSTSGYGAQSPSQQSLGASASPLPTRSAGKGMLNKIMEKSNPTKMTSIFSKRK